MGASLQTRRALAIGAVGLALFFACAGGSQPPVVAQAPPSAPARPEAQRQKYVPTADENVFLDSMAVRTFRWFWDHSDPSTGLTADRAPTRSFASIAATGFALTAYPIGIERRFVSREVARDRVLMTLRFLWTARQDANVAGSIGYKGFYYHFLHQTTGQRFENVELSTIDTALLLGGVLFCQSYFDGTTPQEIEVRALAESIYARVDWRWAVVRPPLVSHGWDPKEGFLQWDWGGYSEAMIIYVLALGAPRHAIEPRAWNAWTSSYKWGSFQGQEHIGFAALFGHQYSHVWIDFRDIQDPYMRSKGIDYFENSRRATVAQYRYAIENPGRFAGYGAKLWGLTACDGPLDGEVEIDGRKLRFQTYAARGASHTNVHDDGTISPTAAGGSIAFTPEIVIPTLVAIRSIYGEPAFGRYGFLDALNPTLKKPIRTQHGRVDPKLGWFDTDYLGIDQGPILAMLENYESDLVWRTMRRNPHIVRGLEKAGFTGGWLDAAGKGTR